MTNYTVIEQSAETDRADLSVISTILAITNNSQSFGDEPQQLECFIKNYRWCSDTSKNEAQQYLQAALIVYEHDFTNQIRLYKEKLFNLVTGDMAAGAKELIRKIPRSDSSLVYHHPDEQSVPAQRFTVPIKNRTDMEWVYYPINTFPRLMPPHTFEVLKHLEENRFTPQSYWVADLVKRERWISVDPILCAQYGRWFVGIAKWD